MNAKKLLWDAAMLALDNAALEPIGEDERAMRDASESELLAWCDDLESRVGLDVATMRGHVAAYCMERAQAWEDTLDRADAIDEATTTLYGRVSGEDIHACYSEGAVSSFFDENTGGWVWVSYSVFNGGLFLCVGVDGFDAFFIPSGLSAEDAAEINANAGGEIPAGWRPARIGGKA